MTRILKDLQPQDIFYYFEEISKIPRGSSNEKAVSDYVVDLAKKLNLEVYQDEHYNVYVKKPATQGYEHLPTVILQGHLDMVCEKNKDVIHDFLTDPIKLKIEGDFITAEGTTLGADNGVAIAYQLAILADNTLEHPALEILMTTAEETGMFGVAGMHPEYLNGKVLLNLDTDEEGEFLVSCAGGKRATLTLPISRCSAQSQQVVYQLAVKGLKGGHSGGDIHLERGNANKILARLLDALRKETEIYLIDYQGGSKDNVITREAEAKIAFNRTEIEKIEQNFQNFFKMVKAEYDVQDAGLTLTKHQLDLTTYQSLTGDSTTKVIDLLYMLPHGVINMSQHIQGLVETSLNMGVVQLDQAVLKVTFSLRSSVASKKEELANRLAFMAKIAGAAITFTGDYPAWRYNENSKIRDLASKLYEEMYGVIPEIKAIHAGLECGYILEKLPHLDMIAFGPNGYDIHTPDERMSITSMRKIYEFLCSLLKNMKSY